MKDDSYIDELLNGYIDEELSQRQVTEVQRLISHDETILERLKQLQKCKELVSSLPDQACPVEMLDNIKESLERRSLLGQDPYIQQYSGGAKQLMMRKLFATAAMIALFCALGLLIYNILAPPGVDSPVASEETLTPLLTVERTGGPAESSVKQEPSGDVAVAFGGFKGQLELSSSDVIRTMTNVRAILEKTLAESFEVTSGLGEIAYTFTCGKRKFSTVLVELAGIWSSFESTKLILAAEQNAAAAIVTDIRPGQIIEILNQDSSEKQIETAKTFAIFNSIAKDSDDSLASLNSELFLNVSPVPKPVLTGSAEVDEALLPESQKVNITIVIIDSLSMD